MNALRDVARRVLGIAAVIISALRDHLAALVKTKPDALVFPGAEWHERSTTAGR